MNSRTFLTTALLLNTARLIIQSEVLHDLEIYLASRISSALDKPFDISCIRRDVIDSDWTSNTAMTTSYYDGRRGWSFFITTHCTTSEIDQSQYTCSSLVETINKILTLVEGIRRVLRVTLANVFQSHSSLLETKLRVSRHSTQPRVIKPRSRLILSNDGRPGIASSVSTAFSNPEAKLRKLKMIRDCGFRTWCHLRGMEGSSCEWELHDAPRTILAR